MFYGKKFWGPKAWYLLHSFSNNNNFKINEDKSHNYFIFFTSFKYLLPCIVCREHYSDILYNTNPLREENISRLYLRKWVFKTHNIVNKLINHPEYSYENFMKDEKYKTINNEDIFFIINILYKNFNYEKISLYNYDQIYNFFIHFCILYPDMEVRKKLKKIIKSKEFKNIQTPKQFINWFDNEKTLSIYSNKI